MSRLIRRLRVEAHFLPSGWVIEVAALVAGLCLIAEAVEKIL